MYEATDNACTELSCSRGQEELAAAAKGIYDLEFALVASMLRAAREGPNLHGLSFDVHPNDLMVFDYNLKGGGSHRIYESKARNHVHNSLD